MANGGMREVPMTLGHPHSRLIDLLILRDIELHFLVPINPTIKYLIVVRMMQSNLVSSIEEPRSDRGITIQLAVRRRIAFDDGVFIVVYHIVEDWGPS
jgi:hypothetical protein